MRNTFARAAAIAVLVIVASALARTYFGHASSPYNVCYGASGRSIPCAVATTSK